jgi:hypothetical protein
MPLWPSPRPSSPRRTARSSEAQGVYQQAVDEYETKNELLQRNASTVSEREVEKLKVAVEAPRALSMRPTPTR